MLSTPGVIGLLWSAGSGEVSLFRPRAYGRLLNLDLGVGTKPESYKQPNDGFRAVEFYQ